jgi:hypothetical protein
MRPGFERWLAALTCAAVPTLGWAQENKDLQLIPEAVQQPAPELQRKDTSAAAKAAHPAHGKLYLEDALTVSSLRSGLAVPVPPPLPPDWQNRLSLDAYYQWSVSESVSATFSDRVNALAQPDVDFASGDSLRNDLREAYLTWEPVTRSYLEAGRINLRSGVALGFNPTDFLKTRTLIDQASLDPSVIRQDRLGTVMLRGQRIWGRGSVSLAFAPKLDSPTPISLSPQGGINPELGRTNAANRLLLSVDYNIADLAPQGLVYVEDGQTRLGLNLSRQIGKSVVAYAEWAGGRQQTLSVRAAAYGKDTGTLPPSTPVLPPSDTEARFRNDLAIGASWATTARVTLNLEYHYHEAGFSREDWRNWFAIGTAFPAAAGPLWYTRAYAAAQQEPVTRHAVFLRADWPDALVSHLELSGFAFVNLYDGSVLTQLAANYYVSRAWTVSAYVSANIGSAHSEYGSQPVSSSAILQVVRYF